MNPPPSSAADVDALAGRARAGDTAAFGEIVERYERLVWKIASTMLADRVTTENLVQQTFVNAYERLAQYEAGRDFERWLKAIARNLLRDELRRRERESQALARYRHQVLVATEDGEADEERRARLATAVAQCRQTLQAAAAEALALRYDRALSIEEVAAALGRSLAASKQLLFRAREAIRICVERRLAAE